ncbi:UNVERIFIED_CONTAM: hypothetical protein FKN15_052628 [Acipenser sinensis]
MFCERAHWLNWSDSTQSDLRERAHWLNWSDSAQSDLRERAHWLNWSAGPASSPAPGAPGTAPASGNNRRLHQTQAQVNEVCRSGFIPRSRCPWHSPGIRQQPAPPSDPGPGERGKTPTGPAKPLGGVLTKPASGNNRRLHQTQAQVNEVVDIMRVNVDKVLERDQKLSELDDRADALQAGASQFETSAARLKRKYWWKNCKVQATGSCV